MEWIKEHPYLTGTLAVLLIVLFFVFRSRSSSSAQVQGGPSEAIQAANLQAGVQSQAIQAGADVQTIQAQAALAAKLAEVQASQDATKAARDVALQNILTAGQTTQYQSAAALEAVQNTNLAQQDIASTVTGGQVQIAGIGANRDIQLATIQAPIALAGISAQLDALKNTNLTAAQIAQINTRGAVDINRQNTGAAGDIATIQASVPLAQTSANLALGTHALDIQHDLEAAQLNYQQQNVQAAFQALPGIGGSQNRTTIITTALGYPGVGAAAQQSEASQAASGSSFWSNFFSGLFGTGRQAATVALASP